jgi:hypothetical protein
MVPGAYSGCKQDPRLPPAGILWPSVRCELGAPLAAVADYTDSNGRALKDLDEVAEPLRDLIFVDRLEPGRLEGGRW